METADTSQRCRCWSFVINNPTESDVAQMMSIFGWPGCSEYAAQDEIGEKCGTPHINGFYYFPNKESNFNLTNNTISYGYLRKSRKCKLANFRYCTKTNTRMPNGRQWFSHPMKTPKWQPDTEKMLAAADLWYCTKHNCLWLMK